MGVKVLDEMFFKSDSEIICLEQSILKRSLSLQNEQMES